MPRSMFALFLRKSHFYEKKHVKIEEKKSRKNDLPLRVFSAILVAITYKSEYIMEIE